MKCPQVLLVFYLVLHGYYMTAQQIPVEPSYSYFENTIIKSTEESENHTSLLAAVKAANLDMVLENEGPFTIFAPSDMAFKKMPPNVFSTLLRPENKQELYNMITYHMVAGNLTASKILSAMCRGEGSATFTTIQGNKLVATLNGIDIVLTDGFGNTATITMADASHCNGVIHVVDGVILPKTL